ncbi:hypothetical protein [Jeotgalibacillus haloalkalitolerans]|uniref:Uncharacterized protein n=1 Tax=Jeotgalibacillus haloalkalitolerans TaxID=3104292 RepID=A0ABU5KIW8_9BACL|nr:hypothetical protein [Jeotgalibacillus sp. HH7-29]MDZ5711202.1 hypothetical protein [Jeotgalibacillus sp. HH7-29]
MSGLTNDPSNHEYVKEESQKTIRVKIKSASDHSCVSQFDLNAKSNVTKVGKYSVPQHEKERKKRGSHIISMLR